MADLTTLSPLPDGSDVVSKSEERNVGAGDPTEAASLVNQYYESWRDERRPYEIQWFVNAAMIRGQQQARWNPMLNKLDVRKAPAHRSTNSINRILPKVRARLAKFIKTRPIPQVVPANTDREAVLNAKATEKALEYQWRRLALETKYEDAIMWAATSGKSFWWFRWNDTSQARVQMPGQEYGGDGSIQTVPLGDVEVEVGTAYEMLVSDPGCMRLADQPMIMRVRARFTSEVEARHKLAPGSLQADTSTSDLFQYQRQIASLGAKATIGNSSDKSDAGGAASQFTHVLVKELYVRPCPANPQGRYVVVAGDQTLVDDQELPMDFGPQAHNPYPVVEFADQLTAGQFWPTTITEQLIGIQREYNDLRNGATEQLRMTKHPKLLVPKQANLHSKAYNNEAGEKIEYHFIPGMPAPAFLQSANIATDTWRMLDALKTEFDDLTSIYPSSVGAPGDNGESGFQTNLLQEASDSVHAPDIRRNELAIEEAAFKIRRYMAVGYDIPRLISIVGKNHSPEVFEFSNENIDEHAAIIVQVGSGMPMLKAARAKMVMEMNGAGLFGDPADPATRRRVLGMLDIGSTEGAVDEMKRDEDQARLENLDISKSTGIEVPMPWENHQIHYELHTDVLKSPELKLWSPEQRDELVRHVILHAKFINPQNAMMLAQQFGYTDLVQQIMPMVAPAQGAPGPQGPPPQGGPQAPPPGPPPGGPGPASAGPA